MNNKETAYKTLERISKVKNRDSRKEKFREELANNRPLAILVQYTYHPDVVFDLPEGELPESIAKKSGHDEPGPLYNNAKKLYQYTNSFQMARTRKEENFINLYESVASDDADLLIAIKDKKLPWKTLGLEFVLEAAPELFPKE